MAPDAQSQICDIAIIGAGISGINAAYRIQENLPNSTYLIFEGRELLGGTWTLFKYPGIRSDSDLYTFGFPFNPWTKPNPIATGESIVEYLHETVEKYDIDRKIRFKHRVNSMDWSSDQQRWRLDIDHNGVQKTFWAKFVIMGTGYYDYNKAREVNIPGLQNFHGQTFHPQFWPEEVDYTDKKIVVIGSGATAITLLPALVENGASKVTMLQRSPSYVMSLPQPKPSDPPQWHQRFFPEWVSLKILRFQSLVITTVLVTMSGLFPKFVANMLRKLAKSELPPDFNMDPHFYPSYNPFEQRLCFCPDADFFRCFSTGRADIVTDTIDEVTETGIQLASKRTLDADIIVTATGLRLEILGKIKISVDKEAFHVPDHFVWRNCMISSLPNFSFLVGYTDNSWTLGSDASVRLVCRVIKKMEESGSSSTTPVITKKEMVGPKSPPLYLQSTYFKGSEKIFPMCVGNGVWKKRRGYWTDWMAAGWGSVTKGLEYTKAGN
ncbi:unnamed protein product [Periconia digitata]|uniref:Flavin-containing monooxygenase n=1 Tax=Periconia digitata TaxID=1303443 RepID=A0A9W4UNN0_9PLEO|nr:unnamed protein product [Periconia digitata]